MRLLLLRPPPPPAASSSEAGSKAGTTTPHPPHPPRTAMSFEGTMSHRQLRALYIERVHEMHPDKAAHRRRRIRRDGDDDDEGERHDEKTTTTAKFVELKNAWEAYDACVRAFRGHAIGDRDDDRRRGGRRYRRRRRRSAAASFSPSHDDDDDDDYEFEGGRDGGEDGAYFTMFGVGCSFADSPEESARRAAIMDQACRGWFPFGSIPARRRDGVGVVVPVAEEGGGRTVVDDDDDDGISSDAVGTMTTHHDIIMHGRGVKLIDDGMFVTEMDDEMRRRPPTTNEVGRRASTAGIISSLVQDAHKYKRGTRRLVVAEGK
jgi:hypothetical protein